MPVYPAVAAQHPENRIAAGQILSHALGAVDFERLSLAKHEETDRMVDLRVDEDDRPNPGISRRSRGLQGWRCEQLGQHVR
jgi:hypothetical protein